MALVAGGGIDSKPLPAALLSQLLPPVRGLRVAAPHSSHGDERTPLIPTDTPASSTSISTSSDLARTTSGTPASSTSASSDPARSTSLTARWSPFGRIGDVFGKWPKLRDDEPNADIDIEMASREAASFPYPVSSMLKANSAPPRWANGHIGSMRGPRFQSNLGLNLNMDSGAGYRQPAASSSVASTSGQSAAESVVGRGTPSGSVVGRGSVGSVMGGGAASVQGVTADWMKKFKGLLVAFVFFVLPIILTSPAMTRTKITLCY